MYSHMIIKNKKKRTVEFNFHKPLQKEYNLCMRIEICKFGDIILSQNICNLCKFHIYFSIGSMHENHIYAVDKYSILSKARGAGIEFCQGKLPFVLFENLKHL